MLPEDRQEEERNGEGRVKDIVAAGWAGAEGAARIAAGRRELLLERFRRDWLDAAARAPEDADGRPRPEPKDGEECVPFSEGGILAALYRIAEERNCGLRIALKEIPVLQSTVEICECFGLNPYRLYSDGLLLLCGEGERRAKELRASRIPAACIGRLTQGSDKLVLGKERPECLNRPAPDELERLERPEKLSPAQTPLWGRGPAGLSYRCRE